MTVRIIVGNCLDELRKMPGESVHCVVSSPPYWGLRDYGIEPAVWGGDLRCEHVWGDELLDRSRRSPGTQNGSLTGDGRYQATACRFEVKSNFCTKCGAWRGDFGLEPTPDLYVEHLVQIFEEVRRVLRPDGTLWLNLGDSYATGAGAVGARPGGGKQGDRWAGASPERGERTRSLRDGRHAGKHKAMAALGPMTQPNRMPIQGLKPKDLVGVPWMAAFALRRAGWWLRGDNIWHKPNPMPESTSDRCTKAHEYMFLLAKSEIYYYDAEAIKEPATQDERRPTFRGGSYVGGSTFENGGDGGSSTVVGNVRTGGRSAGNKSHKGVTEYERSESEEHRTKAGLLDIAGTAYGTRNKRSVWTVATTPFPEAHFATFPTALIEPCVKAGTSERGCCAKCSAPWRRVVGKSDTGRTQKMPDGMATHAGGHTTIHREGRERGATGNPVLENVTLGWWPTCSCEGLAALPPHPDKPGRASSTDESRYKAELKAWLAACRKVDDRRKLMCAEESGRRTAPAVVLDPFGGAGTTGLVADRAQRDAILIEMNPKYAEMARRRIEGDGGLFSAVAAE